MKMHAPVAAFLAVLFLLFPAPGPAEAGSMADGPPPPAGILPAEEPDLASPVSSCALSALDIEEEAETNDLLEDAEDAAAALSPSPGVDPDLILPPQATSTVDGPLVRRALERSQSPAIQKHVAALLNEENREGVLQALERSTRYLPYMLPILVKYGLPTELAYLCVIESGFKYTCRSRKRALGIWQFIRGTSRVYGMRSDNWLEERYDFERSTEAAARYLKDLYELFGDWDLALAGYNCGEHRVQRAVREARKKGKEIVFENLRLPRETRHYVPYFYAGLLIALDPARYGLSPCYEKPLDFRKVKLPGGVPIVDVADLLGCAAEELAALNPSIIKGRVPHTDGGYDIRIPPTVPEERVGDLDEVLKEVPCVEYKVRRGDTLWHIARKYGVDTRAIIHSGSGKRPGIIRPGDILIIPFTEEVGSKKSS